MGTFDNPIVIGILIGLPSAAVAYLGYRRAKQADTSAHEQGTIGQIIAGLNSLVTQLSADNGELRTRVDAMEKKIAELEATLREERRNPPGGSV